MLIVMVRYFRPRKWRHVRYGTVLTTLINGPIWLSLIVADAASRCLYGSELCNAHRWRSTTVSDRHCES